MSSIDRLMIWMTWLALIELQSHILPHRLIEFLSETSQVLVEVRLGERTWLRMTPELPQYRGLGTSLPQLRQNLMEPLPR